MMNENPITLNIQTMDRELGRIEARQEALERRQDALERRQMDAEVKTENKLSVIEQKLERRLDKIQETQEEMVEILQQSRGASKLARWVIGFLAAFGAFVTWALDLWNFGRGS